MKITKKAKKIEIVTYILEMDEAEARFLQDLCTCIGGSPEKSRRRIADRLRSALKDVGIKLTRSRPSDMDTKHSIYFLDEESSIYFLDEEN